MKKNKIKIAHIFIIALTVILPIIAIFNPNLWFDEAYSVGLANQDWSTLISAGIDDVHPVLYYIILKIFTLIFGNSLVTFRLFSLIPIIALSIFSYTHISKKFGEKIGLYFAFILLFLPITLHYSTQIRMYSWAMLFVGITGYYAYSAAMEEYNKKNWIIFSIFSVLSAYTHYFALFTIGIINILMFVYIIRNKRELLKKWFVFGAIQIILYIPGLWIFIKQSLRVAKGFWISVTYPDIFTQIIEFFFKDTIKSGLPSILGLFIFVYMILRVHKEYLNNKKEIKPATTGLIVCGLVVLVTLLVSFYRPVFIPRYMIPMSPLLIFAFATILAKEDKKIIKAIVCIGLIGMFAWNGYTYLKTSYDPKNQEPIEYIRDQIKEGDIIIYKEIGIGSLVAIEFPENNQYFYNKDYWSVEEAYKAFSPQMKTVRDLNEIENYSGRIWVIDNKDSFTYNCIYNMEGTEVKLDKKEFYHTFSESDIVVSLFEKD